MKKRLFLLIAIPLSIFLLGKFGSRPKPTAYVSNNQPFPTIEVSPASDSCAGLDLKIDTLDPTVKENKEAMKVIRENCLLVSMAEKLDITGDNKPELILNTIGAGCVSCHYNEIHFFSEEKEIFTFYGEDINLRLIKGSGFSVTEPLLKPGDSYAKPSEYQSATFSWNGETFIKTKTSPNWVDSNQSRG